MPQEINKKAEINQDQDIAKIVELGFDIKNIVDVGDAFLVEGDIVFRKNELANLNRSSNQRAKQWEVGNRVGSSKQDNIKVWIDPALNAWRPNILLAFQEWNNIATCKIALTEVTSGQDISIVASTATGIGRADFPSGNGQPGGLIEINPFAGPWSAPQQRLIIQHEIGHTLGFRHSNWFNRPDQQIEDPNVSALHIDGTILEDLNSVMYSNGAGLTGTFTENDIAAATIVYPDPYNSFLNRRQYFNGPYNYTGYNYFVGDVDGDSQSDVIGVNGSDERLVVWKSQNFNFQGGQEWHNGLYNYGGYEFLVADVNGDNKSDVIGIWAGAEISVVWLSTGTGFTSAQIWLDGPYSYSGYKYMAADVTGDGKDDIVAVNPSIERFVVYISQGNSFLGGQEWFYTSWNYSGYTFSASDVTGDGMADIIGVNPSDERLMVWPSQGVSFLAAQEWLNGSYDRSGFEYLVGDVTGDNRSDVIAVRKNTEYVIVYQSQGNSFLAGQQWQSSGTNLSAYQFGIGDVHGDSKADLIGINPSDEQIMIWQSLFIYY